MEQWKQHPQHNEVQASNQGRIKISDRIRQTDTGSRVYKGRVVKLFNQYTGKGNSMYQKCHLIINSTNKRNHWVHRIVAETFLPNPDKLKYVDHKDNNGLNNRPSNLQWVTNSINVTKSIAEGKHKNINYYNGKSWNMISIGLGSKNGHLVYRRVKRGWCMNCATTIRTGEGTCSHAVV